VCADDYLVVPLSARELVIRLRARMRRVSRANPESLYLDKQDVCEVEDAAHVHCRSHIYIVVDLCLCSCRGPRRRSDCSRRPSGEGGSSLSETRQPDDGSSRPTVPFRRFRAGFGDPQTTASACIHLRLSANKHRRSVPADRYALRDVRKGSHACNHSRAGCSNTVKQKLHTGGEDNEF
jgi:hypothetical protein